MISSRISFFTLMRLFALPFFVFLAAVTAEAVGPGWIGGGGVIRKDEGNPWWLKNMSEVSVCVEVDEKNFGISEDRAMDIVDKAFSMWLRSFREADRAFKNSFFDLGLGTQKFVVKRGCKGAVDLRISFGLTTPQTVVPLMATTDGKLRDYAGMTVRTLYDSVQMRGKGIIYLSPQSGWLAINTRPDQVKQPWSYANGRLALIVLTHELGHVFGYGHNSGPDITDPQLLEIFLYPEVATIVANWPQDPFFPRFFSIAQESTSECNILNDQPMPSPFMQRFLNVDEPCYSFSLNEKKAEFWVGPTEDGPMTLHAQGDLDSSSGSLNFFMGIFLPVGQKVFEIPPDEKTSFLPMPGVQALSGHVTLRTLDGKVARDLIVQVTEDRSVKAIGTMDGKLIEDIFTQFSWNSERVKHAKRGRTHNASESSAVRSSRLKRFLGIAK